MDNKKHYKDIDEIPVYIFYKIIHTKNINFLIKGYEDDGKEKSVSSDLKEDFTRILQKYNSINSDKNTIKAMKSKARIDIMEFEYTVIINALQFYELTENIEFLFMINEVGGVFKFDSAGNVERQIQAIIKNLKGLKMKIKIAKIKYSKEHDLSVDDKDDEVDHLEELEKRAINIERALELKYPIDTKNTSLLRWCNLIKLTNEKIESNG